MNGNPESFGRNRWRMAAWTAAAALLLLPALAMQATDTMNWGLADFLLAGVLVVGAGVTYELAVRMTGSPAYRAGLGLALATTVLLVWANAAVGLIGSEDNAANLMYGGVLAVAIAGALAARLRAAGMGRALAATGVAQAVVTLVALAAGSGSPASSPLELLGGNGFFVLLWLASALLFRRAAREPFPRDVDGARRE